MELVIKDKTVVGTPTFRNYGLSNDATISSMSGWLLLSGIAASTSTLDPPVNFDDLSSQQSTSTEIAEHLLNVSSSAVTYGTLNTWMIKPSVDQELASIAKKIIENQEEVPDNLVVMLSQGMLDFYD